MKDSWLWQHKSWPDFYWDDQSLISSLAEVRQIQGQLLGIINFIDKDAAIELDSLTLSEQAITTSAIEGEILDRNSVRSSIAHRLGLETVAVNKSGNRYIEGLLDMLLDAMANYQSKLTLERLCGWHAALFPTGYSGIYKIQVAKLRGPGPMQVVSGPMGKEKVHYEAPPADILPEEMYSFLEWFNRNSDMDGILRAGLAHLWFELLHPFADGNGRIGRAIIDLALAQDEKMKIRYYSLSSAIMQDRKNYYSQLKNCCTGNLDITAWLLWFLQTTKQAILDSIAIIEKHQ